MTPREVKTLVFFSLLLFWGTIMRIILDNGKTWEVTASNVIVSLEDQQILGAVVREPKKGEFPKLTLVGGNEVMWTAKIKRIEK